MKPGFELFDHTADMGLRIWAPALAGLLMPAADALYAAIGRVSAGADGQPLDLNIQGADAAVLLRDYLVELLHLFECGHQRVVAIDTLKIFDDTQLAVTLRMAEVDDDTSAFAREVKAVTYHDLHIERRATGVVATVIVDI